MYLGELKNELKNELINELINELKNDLNGNDYNDLGFDGFPTKKWKKSYAMFKPTRNNNQNQSGSRGLWMDMLNPGL